MLMDGAPNSGSLGGGVREMIVRGRRVGAVEKRHLVLKRWFATMAARNSVRFIDVGTDYEYPFFERYSPTEAALEALATAAPTARSYPSSYGLASLRAAFSDFMADRFAVRVDRDDQVMISTGASQTFDALSRTMAGRYVVVPRLALSTVTSIAVANGAEILRIRDDTQGNPDLADLRGIIAGVGPDAIRFIYLNSPANPTGRVLGLDYLRQLVELARQTRVLLVHDHDSWFTVHVGDATPNILQVPGADDVAVSIVSLSKELGLPGLRVGLVAGSRWAVNALRIHNSEFCVMVPEFCQAAAAAALTRFTEQSRSGGWGRAPVQEQIGQSLSEAVAGWTRLGWPDAALDPPQAGFKFLLTPPPSFTALTDGEVSGVELFDFMAARDAGVKFSTSRSFNSNVTDRLRMVIMQPADVMRDVFCALEAAGVNYEMPVPPGLLEQYRNVVADLDLWNM